MFLSLHLPRRRSRDVEIRGDGHVSVRRTRSRSRSSSRCCERSVVVRGMIIGRSHTPFNYSRSRPHAGAAIEWLS